MKGITQDVYQNKSLIKKCQNVIENATDSTMLDPRNCENMPQMPLSQNLTENK
jgi:hypothetical protein